jgi:cysteine desulfurase
MRKIYLDYAATTPTHPEVVNAMLPYFTDAFGNPSSTYYYGQEAKQAIEEARNKVAALIKAHEDEVVFTSGGTEADNFAIKGVGFAKESKGNHIITSAIEHHAVLETCKFMETRGFTVTRLPVDSYGFISPDDVRKALTRQTILITIMHANNEVGTIEPITEISRIAREAGVYFHTDAVQTAGHIPIDVDELGVDLLSMSAHKLYGPKGTGSLFIRKGTRIAPLLHGGEQEKNRRASTENVPGIVGFGKAVELAQQELDEEGERLSRLRDHLITGILEQIDNACLNGHLTERLPNNVNMSFNFVEGESICMNLDLEGICASTGSACSSSSLEPSHVLLAMGSVPEQARSSLRLTSGKWTGQEDINRVLEVLPRIIFRLRSISALLQSNR